MVILNNVMNIDSLATMSISNASNSITFAEALKDKYVNQQEVDDKLVLPKDNRISTDIVLVGFGKVLDAQKQLIKLTSIDLSSKNIEFAGEFDIIKDGLKRVRILNLADNALPWKEVVKIINHLPSLAELVLTNNPLFREDDSIVCTPHRSITSITLGRINNNWDSIIKLLSTSLICVKTLDLWDSQLTNENMKILSSDNNKFIEKIQVLKLSKNNFTDISWLTHIGPVVNLVEVDLSKCELDRFDLDDKIIKVLQNLKDLNISYNNLNTWRSIAALHHLEKLNNLICHENPFFIKEKNAKFLIIGRLGQIVTINREEITNNMKRDSEVFYLRKSFVEYQSYIKGENKEFKLDHPRYEELVDLYGIPEDLTRMNVTDKYVTVDLCYEKNRITKKLPCDMRIANVQMLCKRLFKLKPSVNVKLICRDVGQQHSDLNYELDKDGQTLHFFSVKNGQELILEHID